MGTGRLGVVPGVPDGKQRRGPLGGPPNRGHNDGRPLLFYALCASRFLSGVYLVLSWGRALLGRLFAPKGPAGRREDDGREARGFQRIMFIRGRINLIFCFVK